jgi:hypothetical protein
MKFYDLIVEEIKNKRLFNDVLMPKWRSVYPNLTDVEGEIIYDRHDKLKNQIKPDNPAVTSFLFRYDGNFGTKKYELKDLTDITRFEIKELIEFLKEFGSLNIDLADEQVDNLQAKENEYKKIFNQNGVQKTPEKIEASQEMWKDTSTALINEDGFRVYEIFSQDQSIRMGYYYHTLHLKNFIKKYTENRSTERLNSPWCVTWRGQSVAEYMKDENGKNIGAPLFSHYGNMYRNYRTNHDRTFYFVIDESRPEEDRYHMSALQVTSNFRYILTSMMNDGDLNKSWEEIIEIYPKLSEHKDKIKPRQMSDNEVSEMSITDRINEDPNSQNAFFRQNNQIKELYIDDNKTLKNPMSWRAMGKELRVKYVDLATTADITQRFSTEEFLKEVLNTEGFKNKLNRKLKILGINGGLSYLVANIMKGYKQARISLDNQSVVLFTNSKSQNDQLAKYGLFDSEKFEWVTKNGITYDLSYYEFDVSIWMDENDNGYVVETFTKGGQPDDSSFYSIYSVDSQNILISAHFLSHNAFNILSQRLISTDEDAQFSIIDKITSQDVDIKEIKKGV